MTQVTAAAPYHAMQHGTLNSLGGVGTGGMITGGSRNLSLPSGAISSAPMTTAPTTATTSPRAVSGYDTSTSYEQSRRHVSSVVLSEELLGPMPDNLGVKYVEVPVVEEVVRHVPRRTVVEVEKPIPKFEVEYVERIVEIPEVHFVDRHVDKVQVQEVVRTVPIKQVQEVPREVVRTVPKIGYVQVEKIIEVGQTIEVPKPYVVEQRVDVKRFVDNETPVVVAQTIRPLITEGGEVVDVDVVEYEPQVIPIDVHVAKPIPAQLLALGATSEMHQVVAVPAAQYNTLLQSLNPHLTGGSDMESLPYFRETNGAIPFLGAGEALRAVQPSPNTVIHPAGSVGPPQSGAGLVMPPPTSGMMSSTTATAAQLGVSSRYGGATAPHYQHAHHSYEGSSGQPIFSHPAVAHLNSPLPQPAGGNRINNSFARGVGESGPVVSSSAATTGPMTAGITTGTGGAYQLHASQQHGMPGMHQESGGIISNQMRTGTGGPLGSGPATHMMMRGTRSGADGTTTVEARSVKSERSAAKNQDPASAAGKPSAGSPESAARKSVGSRASASQLPVAPTSTVHKKKACQC